MRSIAFALVLMLVSLAASASELAQFHGEVIRDGAVFTEVSLTVPAWTGTTLKLFNGTVLEFSVSGAPDGEIASVVRLLDANGSGLHSANTPGMTSPKSFRYVICGPRVSFQNQPSDADSVPACPASGV